MKSGYDMWSYASDGLHDVVGQIRENCPGGLAGCVGLILATVMTYRYLSHKIGVNRTKKKIRERQALARKNIGTIRSRVEACRDMVDLSIPELSFQELQSQLQTGKLTCRQVVLSYQAKALEVHNRTNCITGFIEDAEQMAVKLDALKPEERGFLHGVPISMKEVVGVAGQDCTAGFSHFIGKLYDDYGTMPKVLMKQGAIPFARTNIPQGQLSASCSNPIYGRTCNPHDRTRTCGGSSGGEGALLGGHGSVMGIGCDMGGSIRIPSHFCGVVGMRPTSDRMSNHGNLPMGHGIVSLQEVYGPMGRDVTTLVTYMKAALNPELYRLDPVLPPIPWREELYAKKALKIGFYLELEGALEPVPAVKRAVMEAKAALERMGHTLVEFSPPDASDTTLEFAVATLMCDDGKMVSDVTGAHEVIDPSIYFAVMLPRFSNTVRRILAKLLFFLHPLERRMMAVKTSNKVHQWWLRNERRQECRLRFLHMMQKAGVDALIGPTLPVAAWPLDDMEHEFVTGSYTFLYNALDFPCGTLPVTKVTADDVKKMESYPKRYMTEKFIHRITQGSENLPVSVQCASTPYNEEVLLRVMQDVETGVGS